MMCNGDQIVPFVKIWRKIGMVNSKNKLNKTLRTFKHKMHNNRRIPSRSKMYDNLRLRTPNFYN